jgi:hypothetical protein
MQPNETFPSLLSDQMSKQSSSVDQLPYVQSSSVYQPPQDEQVILIFYNLRVHP